MLPSLLLLAALPGLAPVPAATGVFGDWRTPIDAIVRVAPCSVAHTTEGATVCLTVVRVSPSALRGPNGQPTDLQNSDAALRDRPLCGLVVGTGFQQADPDHLAGGHLYDPQTGHTYQGNIAAAGDTLHLRGYVGIPLFGRSETWHRTPTVAACK